MFRLTKEFSFEASHQLMHHDGKCNRLHGHSWRFALIFEGDTLKTGGPEAGMLLDYGAISALAKPVVDELDHRHLNDVLGVEDPTSEFVAMWIYVRMMGRMEKGSQMDRSFKAVVVEETCTSRCEYRP